MVILAERGIKANQNYPNGHPVIYLLRYDYRPDPVTHDFYFFCLGGEDRVGQSLFGEHAAATWNRFAFFVISLVSQARQELAGIYITAYQACEVAGLGS